MDDNVSENDLHQMKANTLRATRLVHLLTQ
jgi:hypothetical protein